MYSKGEYLGARENIMDSGVVNARQLACAAVICAPTYCVSCQLLRWKFRFGGLNLVRYLRNAGPNVPI